jgi:hypothetical protein
MRIKNNESETLYFVWVISKYEGETHQPWMRLFHDTRATLGYGLLRFGPIKPERVDVSSAFGNPLAAGFTPVETEILVRNWGTAPLTIRDAPGPFGPSGRDIGVTLVRRPDEPAPHGCRSSILRNSSAIAAHGFTHTLDCNDVLRRTVEFNSDQ